MKQLLLIGSITAVLLMSGCSTKEGSIDVNSNTSANRSANTNGSSTSSAIDGPNVGGDSSSGVNIGVGSSDLTAAQIQEQNIATLESRVKSVYFDFDKFTIKPDMQTNIEVNAKFFNGSDAMAYSIKVEGNCDEWGTDEYNYALGLKRAKAAKAALVAEGVDDKRVVMVSYGESNPECTEKVNACWAKNRRADFKLLP